MSWLREGFCCCCCCEDDDTRTPTRRVSDLDYDRGPQCGIKRIVRQHSKGRVSIKSFVLHKVDCNREFCALMNRASGNTV